MCVCVCTDIGQMRAMGADLPVEILRRNDWRLARLDQYRDGRYLVAHPILYIVVQVYFMLCKTVYINTTGGWPGWTSTATAATWSRTLCV